MDCLVAASIGVPRDDLLPGMDGKWQNVESTRPNRTKAFMDKVQDFPRKEVKN
jgi:hypothetical protein